MQYNILKNDAFFDALVWFIWFQWQPNELDAAKEKPVR